MTRQPFGADAAPFWYPAFAVRSEASREHGRISRSSHAFAFGCHSARPRF